MIKTGLDLKLSTLESVHLATIPPYLLCLSANNAVSCKRVTPTFQFLSCTYKESFTRDNI